MKWEKPTEVSDLDIVWSGDVVGRLLPLMNEIPEEYKRSYHPAAEVVQTWFFKGLGEGAELTPREGIDPIKALRHLKVCLGSFEPQHEHKTAGVAFLLAMFFKKVKANGDEWTFEKPSVK